MPQEHFLPQVAYVQKNIKYTCFWGKRFVLLDTDIHLSTDIKTFPLTFKMGFSLVLWKTNWGTNNFVTWSSKVCLHQNGQKAVTAARELESKTRISLLTKNICRIFFNNRHSQRRTVLHWWKGKKLNITECSEEINIHGD